MALKGGKQGTRRARSPEAPGAAGPGFAQTASWRANYEASLGGVLASCRRRGGGISTVLKTLGMGKVPEPSQHVSRIYDAELFVLISFYGYVLVV